MTELEQVQTKFVACMEAQQKAVMALIGKQQDPAYQAAERAKKDNVGCEYLRFLAAADGAVKGSAACGKNVGEPVLTGTLTHTAQ